MARFYAFAAGLACILIDYCDAVNYMYSIKRACADTASVAKAPVCTAFIPAAGKHSRHAAVLLTCILIILRCLIAISYTLYKRSHPLLIVSFYSHYRSDLCCHGTSSHGAAADLSLSFNYRSCKSAAAGISAAAAVIAGQRLNYLLLPGIGLYIKSLCRDTQKYPQYQSQDRYDSNRYDDRLHVHIISSPLYRLTDHAPDHSRPENPQKAIAIRPAVTSTIGIP